MFFKPVFVLFSLLLSLLSALSWAQKDEISAKLFEATASKPRVLESTSVWVELTDKTTLPVKQSNGSFSSKNEAMMKLLQSFKISKANLAFTNSKRASLKTIWELTCSGCNLEELKKNLQTISGVKRLATVSPIQAFYEPNDLKVNWPGEKPVNFPSVGFTGYSKANLENADYSLEAISAQSAWDITQGSESVVIGISESGVDDKHPELAKKIAFISPLVQKIGSPLFLSNTDSMNALKHGTMVGITAAGNTNNKLFKSSIGFKSKLAYYGASYDELLKATYAGIKVINVSWGSCASSKEEQEIQAEVINEVYENGTFIVAAAGNGNITGLGDGSWSRPLACNGNAEEYVFPASFKNVFSVTGTGKGDAFVDEATVDCDNPYTLSYNDRVDLSAPGLALPVSYTEVVGKPHLSKASSVTGIVPNGFTGHRSLYLKAYGTSLSSALVSGTVGLMLSVNPNLGPASLEYILKKSAANINSVSGKCSNKKFAGKMGAGRLDASKAVAMAKDFPHLEFAVKPGCKLGEASASVNLVGDASASDYRWSNGSTEQVVKNLQSGKYYVSVIDKDERVIDGVVTVPAYSAGQMLKACGEAQLATGAGGASASGGASGGASTSTSTSNKATSSSRTSIESGASATQSSTSAGGTSTTASSGAATVQKSATTSSASTSKLSSTLKPNEAFFDASRKPFLETEEGKNYLKKYGKLPEITDAFGYPMPVTPLKKQEPKFKFNVKTKAVPTPVLKPGPKTLPKKINPNVKSQVKTSFLKMIFDFIFPNAMAWDADPAVPGLINCRPAGAPPTAGYFKAYFEDIADNTNHGYDDSTFGTARVNAVCDVFQEIANIIMLDEPGGATPEVLFTKNWPSDAPLAALATGSPYIPVQQAQTNTHSGFLHQHIITRIDPDSGPDGVVNTNWAPNISWSVDSSLNSGTFDFKSVMRHEILHALGFMSRLPANISSTNSPVPHNHWDRNLLSPSTNFLSTSLSPLLQAPVGSPSSWFNNDASIYNGRKNYVNAPLDGVRPLYSPLGWQQGSSLSHFDMNRLVPPNSQIYIMHPSIAMGVQKSIHNHEKEVLCHLGYQVRNMTGCALPTPIANNDIGLITSANTCISFLANDYSLDAGDLSLESYELILPPPTWAQMTFYTSTDCTSSWSAQTFSYNSFSSAQSANAKIKSIKVATGSIHQVVMKYRIKDSVSNRISDTAEMNYSKCVVAADEYVCNGDFEMPTSSTNITLQNSGFPLWGIALNTPDPVFKNLPSPHSFQNLPYAVSGIIVDMVDNGTKSVFMENIASVGSGPNNEKIGTRLKSPLIPGECYKLAFDITMINLNGSFPFNIMASLSTSNLIITNNLFSNPAMSTAIPVLNQSVNTSIGANAQWYNVSKIFSPTQAFEYLAIHMPDPTNVPAIGGFGIRSWVDNISLKKIDQSLCPNNSISGIVYNDINTNGSMGLGESVLQFVNVALVDATNGTILDESLTNQNGEYKFNAVAPAPQYFVVLKPENLFQTITEPITNNILNNYQHTRSIPFTNGGIVSGENFGVLLSGQGPQTIPPISLSASSMIGCGANNGSIDLSVSGGLPPFAYSWSNGQSTQDLNGIPSGSYTVTVTDSSSPTQTATLSSTVPALVPISINGVVSLNNINVTATGNAPLNFSWSNGATTEDLSNLNPGAYTVVVTDSNSCSQSATFNIIPPPQSGQCCKIKPNANPLLDCSNPLLNLGNSTVFLGHNQCVAAGQGNSCYWDFSNPACCYPGAQGCGSNPGTTCAPPAQSIPYPYSILNVSTPLYSQLLQGCMTQAQQSGSPQTYYCCVTLPGNLNVSGTWKPSCGINASSIDLSVSGGTAPYTYSWSNGASTQDISNLAPGNYTVNVTSADGLVGTLTVAVQAISPVIITGSTTPPTLPNYNNGSINISVAPAVGYTYNWVRIGGGWPGSNSEDIQNLIPGSYKVTATNTYGCQASKTFKILKMLKPVGVNSNLPKQ